MEDGNLYMAHRCGFTQKVLAGTLRNSGFSETASAKRGAPYFDLWIVGAKGPVDNDKLRQVAMSHFPGA